MVSRVARIATALVLGSALVSTAQSQTNRMHLGPRISYQFDLQRLGIGAQFSVPIVHYLEFYPSFDYFINSGSFWNLNADLKYRVPSESVRWLYLGGGLNLAHASHNTRAGVNLFGGVESLSGRVHPFAEFRFTANHGSTGQMAVGLNFTLGQQ
jgi:hypothetical protein